MYKHRRGNETGLLREKKKICRTRWASIRLVSLLAKLVKNDPKLHNTPLISFMSFIFNEDNADRSDDKDVHSLQESCAASVLQSLPAFGFFKIYFSIVAKNVPLRTPSYVSTVGTHARRLSRKSLVVRQEQ